MDDELGLTGLDALLQQLVDGKGVFDQQPALVDRSWIHKAALSLFYHGVQLCVNVKKVILF